MSSSNPESRSCDKFSQFGEDCAWIIMSIPWTRKSETSNLDLTFFKTGSAGECSVDDELKRVAGGSNILDFADVAALLLLPLSTCHQHCSIHHSSPCRPTDSTSSSLRRGKTVAPLGTVSLVRPEFQSTFGGPRCEE